MTTAIICSYSVTWRGLREDGSTLLHVYLLGSLRLLDSAGEMSMTVSPACLVTGAG